MKRVVFDGGLTPTSEVKIEIGATTEAAFLAIICVNLSVKLVVENPFVTAFEERPVATAIAGHEMELVAFTVETLRVEREIKHRDVPNEKDGVARLEIFSGNNLDAAGADASRGFGNIVCGDVSTARGVGLVRGVARKVVAVCESRGSSHPK